jgi:glycolate oxidase FAD binding subunit
VEFVSGEGKIIRGGGRVVKNVAGYDLVRLVTGSWGTLGVITEATLRLYALPKETLTVSLGVPDGPGALKNRIASVLDAPGSPFAVELISAALSEKIGLASEPQLLVRLGGNAAAVNAQHAAITALGGPRIVKSDAWEKLRVAEDERTSSTTLIRLSTTPAKVADVWVAAAKLLRDVPDAMMHSTPFLGIVRCILPSSASREIIEKLSSIAPSVVYERMPTSFWSDLSPTVVGDRISQGVKRAFDPSNILNPGILGHSA